MSAKPIKKFLVEYEDGTLETFEGAVGYVHSYNTKHKNEKGDKWESVTVHEASMTTKHGDWKAAPQ